MKQSLFTEKNNSESKKGDHLIKLAQDKTPLSKEQQQFNKYLTRIKKLQTEITRSEKHMHELNTLYQKDVYTKIVGLGELKIELAKLLHKRRKTVKLTNTQSQKLDTLILLFLDDAFCVVEADETAMALFDEYNRGSTYEEELKEEENEMKKAFSEMFFQQFGISIDPEHLDGEPDPEKIQAHLEAQFKALYEQEGATSKKNKKTKKQLAKEDLLAKKEEVKNKTVRSIYLSLAKILHPDTEMNEYLKKEKEELMKNVTAAYNNNNLLQLLNLEMEWVNKNENKLAGLDNSTIKIYTELLKDQVAELEQQLYISLNNTAFTTVKKYAHLSQSIAVSLIKKESAGYENTNKLVAGSIASLQKEMYIKQAIVDCIKKYYEEDMDEQEQDASDIFEDMLKAMMTKRK